MNRLKRFSNNLARKWQGVEVGEPTAKYGKGKFVDVLHLRGARIKLVNHKDRPRGPKGTLIMTPVQYNHGFLVKFTDENGVSHWTNILSFDDIYQLLGKQRERKK